MWGYEVSFSDKMRNRGVNEDCSLSPARLHKSEHEITSLNTSKDSSYL